MNRRTCIALVCFIAVVLAIKWRQPTPPESLVAVKHILEGHGYHCFIRETKTNNNILIVSTQQFTEQQAIDFSLRPKPGEGKIAITEYLRGFTRRTDTEAHWDGYFASGDGEILNQVEQILFP